MDSILDDYADGADSALDMPEQAIRPALGTPQPPPTPQPAPQLREFGDSPALRQAIFERSLQAARATQPVKNSRYQLSLQDVDYAGPDKYTLQEQKKAILTGNSVTRKLQGTWVLQNTAGEEITRRKAVLARVPYLTDRGTFINNGSEYSLSSQLRLKPGLYSRIQSNGVASVHANVKGGAGHKLLLDPATGVFQLAMHQSVMPLVPLLKAMGVTDTQLRDAWGQDLANTNAKKNDPQMISKLHKKLIRKPVEGESELQSVVNAFQRMEIDPEVSMRTLGKPHKNLNAETLLDATKKLLAVSRKEAEPDDRDAMPYQTVHGPEDIISERLSRNRSTLQKLLWKASAKGELGSHFTNALDSDVRAALLGSRLGQVLTQINMAEVLDQQHRISRMGEGGISSSQAVPDESREVSPSHLAFIDPLRTSECFDAETEVMTRQGWKKWPEVTEDDELADLVDDELRFSKPIRLISYRYEGIMHGADNGKTAYLVTPNHRIRGYSRDWAAGHKFFFAEDVPRYFGVQTAGFGAYAGDPSFTHFELPTAVAVHNSRQVAKSTWVKNHPPIVIDDWCEFMGWWLGEGSTNYNKRNKHWRTRISQSKSANPTHCRTIEALLSRLPFAWSADKDARGYTISGKAICSYMMQFGKSPDRFIPEELFNAPTSARQKLLTALLNAEGTTNKLGRKERFNSTSLQLAKDFQRLAFSLGIATTITFKPDTRPQSTTGGCWGVSMLTSKHRYFTTRYAFKGRSRYGQSDHYRMEYSGQVYCATMPGGLLYVRRDGKYGHWSGNSGSVGVDLRLAAGSRLGPKNTLYTRVRDKAGEFVYKSPSEIADGVFAFPGELSTDKQYVTAIRGGKLTNVHRDKVDYELPEMEHGFSPLANLVPGKSAVKGQRLVMASRMLQQALPLQDAEAPYVQSEDVDNPGKSYEERYASFMGAARAKAPGRVTAVTPDGITITHPDGTTTETELANAFPLNQKTQLHQTATVKVGDFVKPGQLIARSNFTDKDGTMAMGKNLRIAYLPYDGKNWEDASVISETAAKMLNSEHVYKHDHEWAPEDKRGKNTYVSIFPSKYSKETLAKFNADGTIKPGTVVQSGDPLVLVATARDRNKKSMIRGNQSVFQDKSEVWDQEYPGVVTDVVATDKGAAVVVKAYKPSQVGDKLSGRYGDKGIISAIIPDDDMPHDESGKPFHILVSPLGLTSRINPMQMVESALGKIAEKTGKPYKLRDFDVNTDLAEFGQKELERHGLSDEETVIDPRTGRKIPNIATGNRWFMKLHHMAADKVQGRGLGAYDSSGAPAGKTDQSDSSKKIGLLEVSSILSSGASGVMREAGMLRGQANPKYWADFMSGYDPKAPDVPFVYEKFVNMLRGVGINPVRTGNKTHLMALTDRDIDELSGDREIKTGDTVNWKDMSPIVGGLFDPTSTGGHGSTTGGGGKRWSHIKLHTPLPNPAFEDPIRRVLGLTKPKFESIMAGRDTINGESGPAAIHNALKKIDLPRALQQTREQLKSTKKTQRDEAVRKLGFLKAAEKTGVHPSEWVVSKVPVLPPIFRPVSTMGPKKLPLVDDMNYVYKELIDANNTAKDLREQLDEKDIGDETLATYNAFKAVTGLGDPTNIKNQERGVKGILKHILGSGGPKTGMVQRKLLGASTDFVTRGVIAPNPDLTMDQVAIPEEKAWSMYQPMLVRRLVRTGMSKMDAMRAVEEKQPAARRAMSRELEDAVVLFNRAPTLHRYGIMAARPVLTKNKIIEMNPFVYKGLGADNDGDQMNIHALTTQSAKEDALGKMLPSKNLFDVAKFGVHQMPSKDYVAGLHAASTQKDDDKPVMYFDSKEAAMRAYHSGKIGLGRRIKIIDGK